ncbi:hypothetical protein LMH87_001175 [Akanthomyces muscarius]|uniref:Major facilitator superfamily (MFS) profile domain-containing protein n=1 Tax=Akanthomyces muscarius TaxID=2231603 RepID=A0A9W8QIU4_AKAMU|nr:hypothetical protein LMH87_001175 [Akanthomyces muscarius]KAJ4155955.1 hypothetical protein LMH87_001175 [Akanthomyces muscarius]
MKPSVASLPESDKDEKKEFGLHGTLTLVGAFAGFFCTVGFFNSFGLFESYYQSHQLADESQSTISWLAAVSTFLLYSGSIVCGSLLDAFGPMVMIYLGAFGTVLCPMMLSLCGRFWEFMLAQGVLFGISMALTYTPVLGVIGQHIKRSRAAAMGVVIAGSSLGGVIWPIMLQKLIYNPHVGFAWALRIVGFMMLPLLGLTCVLPEALLTCLAFFVIYFGMFTPLFFTASFASTKGFSEDLSFYTISIMNAASLFGRVAPGFLADSYGRFNICIVMTISSGVAAYCWNTVTSVAGLVIFSLAYGFFSGAILSLQQACAAQISTPLTMGRMMGVVMASASLSGLAGIPVGGQLSEKYGYQALSMYAGTSLILGGVLLAAARFKQQRSLWSVI